MDQEQTKRMPELGLPNTSTTGMVNSAIRRDYLMVNETSDSLSTPLWAWCLIFFVFGLCVALIELVAHS